MKKIIIALFLVFSFQLSSFSYYDKVENVFLDINSNYKYYGELQNLYEKGMIKPDENGKFNPNKLLTRDEFVGIAMEVGCTKCIKPDTALDYILKFSGKSVFYDVEESNKFFYCIAEAKEDNSVKGYGLSYKCDDGTTKSGESPFCTNNNITLEEAIAVLLRNSSVFTINDNNIVLAQIAAGTLTKDLAKDVKVKNSDGSVYTFYGYFKKALELSYTEYDLYGNAKKYTLVDVDSNGNLNPKKYISKEEFLKMSYIISKINSCNSNNNSTNNFGNTSIAGKINILDKTCSNNLLPNCKKSDLKDDNGTYDYDAEIKTTCEKGMKDYVWIFYNKTNQKMFYQKGKFIDNYKFSDYGDWQIKLIGVDNCGNKIEIYNENSYLNNSQKELGVSIEANPIIGKGPLSVNFNSIVKNCENCKYDWNFGDGNTSNLSQTNNVFVYNGVYKTELVVTDLNGNKAGADVFIKVVDTSDLKNQNLDIKNIDTSKIDTDGDGVFDNEDKCIVVKGDVKNSGCPILDETCFYNEKINTCKSGYICNKNGYCEIKKETSLEGTCIYPKNGSSVFGNVICDSCPCDYNIDFLANIRKCDVLVPSIVSPNGKDIYSRGDAYQIPYEY